jgi:hypothetical protein
MKTLSKIGLLTSMLLLPLAQAANHDSRDDRDDYYDDRSNSSPAAPSTIPGQGDSKARVPNVKPVPQYVPAPRKPKHKTSPWGGTASNPPAAPQPPVAQPGGTGSGPVVVTPGTPPGTSVGSAEKFRGSTALGANNAIIKGSTNVADASAQKVTSTVLSCTKTGNTPKINRINPDNSASLRPGGAFIIEGMCFGNTAGGVQVTLPTQYGRIQMQQAKVLDWNEGKIIAQLPEGVTKAIPGDAAVEVTSSSNARSRASDFIFEPRWEEVQLKDLKSMTSIETCNGGVCKVTDTELIGTAQRSNSATDRYLLQLTNGIRLSSCSLIPSISDDDGKPDGVIKMRVEGASVNVDWYIDPSTDNDFVHLSYRVKCYARAPAGLVTP